MELVSKPLFHSLLHFSDRGSPWYADQRAGVLRADQSWTKLYLQLCAAAHCWTGRNHYDFRSRMVLLCCFFFNGIWTLRYVLCCLFVFKAFTIAMVTTWPAPLLEHNRFFIRFTDEKRREERQIVSCSIKIYWPLQKCLVLIRALSWSLPLLILTLLAIGLRKNP